MKARHWSAARRLREAQAHWAPRVATGLILCWRCARPIDPSSAWEVGHQIPLAQGGSVGIDNTLPEHAGCASQAALALAEARRLGRLRAGQQLRVRRDLGD